MSVSTITADIQSLNAEVEAAKTSKRTNITYLLSTCTESDAIQGMSTIKSQYISTIEGILPQISEKKHELAALKKK